MTDEKILRINELYRKSKTEQGLTEQEKNEQKTLREEYVKGFRASLDGQLKNMSIKEKDGSITPLTEIKKRKNPFVN